MADSPFASSRSTGTPRCIVCQSAATTLCFTANLTRYYQCQGCSVVFTNQVPQTVYEDWSKSPGYTRWEEYLDNVFTRIVHDIQRFKPDGRVLEIGSSLGYLLRPLIAAGFDAEGIEPSRFAVDYCRQRGLKVTEGYFDSSIYRDSTFDIVILNHVLEHVPNPSAFLGEVRTVLKTRGIVFVSLPNFGSIEAQILRQRWRFLMPEEHYVQFTPRTLSAFLSAHGFDVVDVKTTVRFTELADPWKEATRAFARDKKSLAYYLVEFLPAAVEQALGKGTGLQVIALKAAR
jgi:2-polyprenyl-3-methyl-5-hydroxy-6-metoxy-1,4-benzoquinol methylase